MSKVILRQYHQQPTCMFPVSLDEKVLLDSPVRLIDQIVDDLDISKVIATYKGGGTSS